MNASNSGGVGAIKMIIGIVVIIIVLVALYFLYKYLFTSSGLEVKVANDAFVSAKTNATSFAVNTSYPNIPIVYTGGEFTVSSWIYVSDWQNVNGGKPKHIFTLGKDIAGLPDGTTTTTTNSDGTTTKCTTSGTSTKSGFADANAEATVNEQTLVVYLDAYNNELHTAVSLTDNDASKVGSGRIMKSDVAGAFGPNGNIGTLKSKAGAKCSIKDVELQKWILFTFCMNNKVLDIYMDGKLARSCVLPSMYSVGSDPTKPMSLKMAGYGGFGGFIGRTVMTNYAMNPEEVWKLYMSGPGPEPSFWNSFKSLFDPNFYKDVKFPTLDWE